jgi:hypothetical protein
MSRQSKLRRIKRAFLPPMGIAVMVTTAGGHSFLAKRINPGFDDCDWARVAVEDQCNRPPDCWTDGMCWAENAEGVASDPVCEWRSI